MGRYGSRQLRVGQQGGGFSKLSRGKLAFADQGILHGLRQAAEEVGVEENVGICW